MDIGTKLHLNPDKAHLIDKMDISIVYIAEWEFERFKIFPDYIHSRFQVLNYSVCRGKPTRHVLFSLEIYEELGIEVLITIEDNSLVLTESQYRDYKLSKVLENGND